MQENQSTASAPFDIGNRRARLLVVDDQPINIQVMHQIFSGIHDVFMSTSGEQALAFCRKTPPDLVLLDVEMPGMDGREVCRQLKHDSATKDIPIIFVTGHSQPDQETACWVAGAVDFVNKPVNPITLLNRVRVHLTLKLQADLLRDMAFIDGLTGVANRRFFDAEFEKEWQRLDRTDTSLSLILADVDFFKLYNDHYGHLSGDDCLRSVAGAFKSVVKRPTDLVARYGGEEFVFLLPNTDLVGATTLAHSLEKAVRDLKIEHVLSKTAKSVTVSLGVSCAVHSSASRSTPQSLIQSADAQLYRSKQSGRGRVCADT